MSEERACEALRSAIEVAVDRKMRSPRDFDFLAQAIFEKVHQSVSASTLKRFWGYLPKYDSTRISTLNVLSQFIDFKDWDEFYASLTEGDAPSECSQPATDAGTRATSPATDAGTRATSPATDAGTRVTSPATDAGTRVSATDAGEAARAPKVKNGLTYWMAGALLLFIIVVGGVFLFRSVSIGGDSEPSLSVTNGSSILRRGQIFPTYSDYLRLFGITEAPHFWDQPLPHHDGIIIWGPEYHHPQWHNEGERDSLMPTITEWWEPADSLDAKEREMLMAVGNAHLYFTVMRTNELRITFMKNLTDTGYVFLGIYRTNLQHSDSTHVVWERVADECDLSNLAYLQQLRH